jgi:hypothetical protein
MVDLNRYGRVLGRVNSNSCQLANHLQRASVEVIVMRKLLFLAVFLMIGTACFAQSRGGGSHGYARGGSYGHGYSNTYHGCGYRGYYRLGFGYGYAPYYYGGYYPPYYPYGYAVPYYGVPYYYPGYAPGVILNFGFRGRRW